MAWSSLSRANRLACRARWRPRRLGQFDPAELRAEACQLSGGRITGTPSRMDQYNGLDCTTTEATEGLPGPMASLGDKAKFAPDALRAEACQLSGGRITGTVRRMDQYNGLDCTTTEVTKGLAGPMASLGDSIDVDAAALRPEACCLWWPHHGHRPPHGPVQWPRLHDDGGDGGPSGPDGEPRRQAKFAPDALRAEACQLGGGRPSGWVVRMDPYNGMDMTTDAFPRE